MTNPDHLLVSSDQERRQVEERVADAPALVVAGGPCEPGVRTIPTWLAWLEPTLLALDFRQATICRFGGH
jgi:hypothetical protein